MQNIDYKPELQRLVLLLLQNLHSRHSTLNHLSGCSHIEADIVVIRTCCIERDDMIALYIVEV